MAVCISLMFARLGSVLGSSVGAILLEAHCEYTFYLSGSTLIRMFFEFNVIYSNCSHLNHCFEMFPPFFWL